MVVYRFVLRLITQLRLRFVAQFRFSLSRHDPNRSHVYGEYRFANFTGHESTGGILESYINLGCSQFSQKHFPSRTRSSNESRNINNCYSTTVSIEWR